MEKSEEIGEKVTIENNPIKSVSEFFSIKSERLNIPKRDEKTTTITEVLKARRDQENAQKNLSQMREHVQIFNDSSKKKWADLMEQQRQLRTFFIDYNKFIFENHNKRLRSQMQIEKETALQEKMTKKTNHILEKIQQSKEIQDNLCIKLKKYDSYKSFLERVVKNENHVVDAKDLVNRYEVLKHTLHKLAGEQTSIIKSVEKEKSELSSDLEKKQNIVLELSSKLAILRNRFATASSNLRKWNGVLEKMQTFADSKSLETNQVRMFTWNLYKTMCERKRLLPNLDKSDTENQLLFIIKEIQELKQVLAIVYDRQQTEPNSIFISKIS